MAYKSWNLIQLTIQLRKVKAMGDKIDEDIIKQLLNDSIIPFDNDSYPNTKEFNKAILDEYSYYLPYIQDLSLKKPFNIPKHSPISIPIESQLEFLYEFFSTTTPEWMNLFDSIYKERKKNLKFANSGNYSIYLGSIDYSYISLNKNYEIDDLFNLVHEYTHSIIDRINYRMSYNSHYPFIEIGPLLMECISALLMREYYLDIDSNVEDYLKEILNLIITYSKNIININDSIDTCTIQRNADLMHDISYVIPYIHIFELFYLYLSDKEKWFYTLNRIIEFPPTNNYIEEMKKLGLTPNRFMDRYINDLNNHLKV